MAERLAYDIARDLRARGPWPSEKLLGEAADKLEGLIELLAQAERDQARAKHEADMDRLDFAASEIDHFHTKARDMAAEVERLRAAAGRAAATPDGGEWHGVRWHYLITRPAEGD